MHKARFKELHAFPNFLLLKITLWFLKRQTEKNYPYFFLNET